MASETLLSSNDGQINKGSTGGSWLAKLTAISALVMTSVGGLMVYEGGLDPETAQKQRQNAEQAEKEAEEAVKALREFLAALEAKIDETYDSLSAERKDGNEQWDDYARKLRPAVSLFNSLGIVPSKDPFGDQLNEKKLLELGLPANCLDKMNRGFSSSERHLSEALRLEEIQDDNEKKEEEQAYTKRVKDFALLRLRVTHMNEKYAERTRWLHNIHIGNTEDGLPLPQTASQDDHIANRGN